MTIEETLDKVQILLEVLVNRYFEGTMSLETAFGITQLAWAHIDAFNGDKSSQDLLTDWEKEDHYPDIYPTDEVIQGQIHNLQILQDDLQEYDEVRSKFIFWSDKYDPEPPSAPHQ